MNELQATYTSGAIIFATISNPAGLIWNGSAYVAASNAVFPGCASPVTEAGATGFYFGNIPSNVPAGELSIGYRQQLGSVPAYSDTPINSDAAIIYWPGSPYTPPSPTTTVLFQFTANVGNQPAALQSAPALGDTTGTKTIVDSAGNSVGPAVGTLMQLVPGTVGTYSYLFPAATPGTSYAAYATAYVPTTVNGVVTYLPAPVVMRGGYSTNVGAGQTLAVGSSLDFHGYPKPNVPFVFQALSATGLNIAEDAQSISSDDGGRLQVVLAQSQKYRFRRGGGGWVNFTTGTDSRFPLPGIVGTDLSV